jgi:cyclophilin family peptidyl-prolyl cis-trans isomerase
VITRKLLQLFLSCILISLGAGNFAQAEDTLPDYPKVSVETSAGNFTMELFYKRSPLTVRNFVDYVESGFYNDVIFHRVVAGFVVQAGGYDSSYKEKATRPTIPNESGNGLSNKRGSIAMARTSSPHSADSQFFINLGDSLMLDPSLNRWGYTVFGRVIEGMTVVDQIGYVATGPGPVPQLSKDVPAEAVIIFNMTMLDADPQAEAKSGAAEE